MLTFEGFPKAFPLVGKGEFEMVLE